MIKLIIYSLIIYYLPSIHAQNLIPNPSFEDANADSAIIVDFGNNFTCKEWNSPIIGTPDYFTINRTGDFGCPKNRYGSLMAHTGSAYCGFVTKYNGSSYEYLQVKLNKKLVKDSSYCISLYVSVPQYAVFTTNEINCFFTKEKNTLNLNYQKINNSSYVRLVTKENYIKPSIWNQLINYYKAKGEEEYMVIGMLNSNYKNIKIRNVSSNNVTTGIYMLIDDVSLKPISDSSDCKLDEVSNIYNEAISKPLILKLINFETNKAVLKNTSNPELIKLANYLKQNPSYKIQIAGYTDNSGTEINNIALSYARAKSVAEFLINEKIPKKNITYKGMGSQTPLVPNSNEENKLKNRRVEVLILK